MKSFVIIFFVITAVTQYFVSDTNASYRDKQNLFVSSTREFLEKSTTFELYSLQPGFVFKTDEYEVNDKLFHSHIILGKTVINDKKVKAKLIKTLYRGIANYGVLAGCFYGRHGIRAIADNKTLDLLICFQCGHIWAYEGKTSFRAFTNDKPAELFNAVLQANGIPLGSKSKFLR
jgi:hypothetical protein